MRELLAILWLGVVIALALSVPALVGRALFDWIGAVAGLLGGLIALAWYRVR